MSAVHVTLAYHQSFQSTVARIMEWNDRFQADGDLIMFARDARDIDRAARDEPHGDLLRAADADADRGRPRPDRGAPCAWRALHAAHLQQSVAARLRLDGGRGRRDHAHGPAGDQGNEPPGMVVDMSHSGERTTLAAIDLSERPIAVTHANPTWWCPGKRGKSRPVLAGARCAPRHARPVALSAPSRGGFADDARKLLPHGGAKLRMWSAPPISASDRTFARTSRIRCCDGCGKAAGAGPRKLRPAFPPQPPWFQDNRDFPRLAEGLRRAGFGDSETAGVLGENWYRFMRGAFAPAPALHQGPAAAAAAPASPPIATARFMAMKGAGYYSKSTPGARDAINAALPLVTGAIERMQPADDGSPLRVADFGCADGGTSLEMWRNALAFARRLVPSRPIEIVYTDLPRNDFSQLFRMIHGQTDTRAITARSPSGSSLRVRDLVPRRDLSRATASTSPSPPRPRTIFPRYRHHFRPCAHGRRARRGTPGL